LTRDIDPATAAAAAAAAILPVAFLKAEFDGGNVCLHSRLGSIAFGGDTYAGVGTLGAIDTADEVSDLSMTSISLTLSGLPVDIISTLLNEQYQGRRATLSLGYLDATTRQLVGAPFILFRGIMDTADFDRGKTFAVTLSVGNRFAAWNQPKTRRYNNADQQSRYPSDRGLEFIEQTTNKTVVWGGAS
jgi:hypothetical protein